MTTTALPPSGGSVAELWEARRNIRQLRDVMWAARAAGEKMEAYALTEEIRSELSAIGLEIVADLEGSKEPERLGWASTKDFVTAVSGGHKGAGRATVRLAQALQEPVFAPVAEALADGWLSTTKAHVIERAVDLLPSGSHGEIQLHERGVQVLLDEAKRLDATELKKIGRHLVWVIDPDGVERRDERAMEREERAAHLDRELSIVDDGAGGARIRGRCSSEDGALIKTTLMSLAAPRPSSPDGTPTCDPDSCREPGCSHDGRDPRDHGARMLDAMVEACRRLQSAHVLPASHGVSTRLTVTMSYDDLRDQTGHGTTATGEELSPQALRRLACDAEIVPVVLGADSVPLDVGRAMRLVTSAIWYAVMVRDKHCRFPGCTRPPVMCHAHHVRHWVEGGPTSLDNLVLVCSHHHRLIHSGPWTITQPKPGLFVFAPPDAVRRARGPRPDRAPPCFTRC